MAHRAIAVTLLAALVAYAGGARAIVYREVSIERFEMCVRRENGPPTGVVTIVTRDDSGEDRTVQANVGDVLTAQERSQMRTFLTGVLARIYDDRAIPTPTPTPIPTPTPTPTPTRTPTPTPSATGGVA